MDLTGFPTEIMDWPVAEGAKKGDPIADFEDVEDQAIEMFELLQDYDEEGYVMTTETSGLDEYTEKGGPDKAEGLVPGHAYSIISVKEHEEEGLKLLKIRNPWGSFEWGGAWSDNSELWTDELREYFEVEEANDGTFWISLEDFILNFNGAKVCKVGGFEEIRLKGKFIKAVNDKSKQDFVYSKFSY